MLPGVQLLNEYLSFFSIAAGCDTLQNKAQCIELHHIHDSNTKCCSVFLGHAKARQQGGVLAQKFSYDFPPSSLPPHAKYNSATATTQHHTKLSLAGHHWESEVQRVTLNTGN
ncbi:hypothetical protein E2C01_023614 [Portunus trituberculatus]|uniref:Uncharacterized protein n=1 Tax=Portunus trituberculatus TaxID=210409 RepID=A0A5B7E8P2_PORTR|nr:hypothetical protein [Portunus trituberculatus]